MYKNGACGIYPGTIVRNTYFVQIITRFMKRRVNKCPVDITNQPPRPREDGNKPPQNRHAPAPYQTNHLGLQTNNYQTRTTSK